MITLRPHQLAAADAVEAAFRAGIARPLADMCVGSGKSLTFAELARREIARGGRMIICAHTRELVEQNASACRSLGLSVGVNAAALDQRAWRGPVISAAIQSVHRYAHNFGQVTLIGIDESHLCPHSESGMYRQFIRGFPSVRVVGASGTVFRLQGGSLVDGEDAPFEKVVFRYGIVDGIRDGYLVPAFSVTADDKMDPTKLRTRQGEYTGDSQDAQMIAAMDNHIAQMVHHGAGRRAWLVFEASVKAAHAMAARMREWGIPTGVVLGETPAAERAATIRAFREGRLRALVNRDALTTGFDVQEVDMLVMRRRTKSLGLYSQIMGRLLRTIGGNIAASIAAGKEDGIVLDFAGNIDQHGPLDFIQPRDTKPRLVSCDSCGARNGGGSARCWKCESTMTKLCPACLESIARYHLDCPLCAHDMRMAAEEREPAKLRDTPSGAALIASWKGGVEREGGWLPVSRVWCDEPTGDHVALAGDQRVPLAGALVERAAALRWVRADGSAGLVPNGAARITARQISVDGAEMIVPLPALA